MLNTLLRKLRERRDLRVREGKLREAQRSRSNARQAYLDAWTRGDTRDMHRAELKLKSATLAELMASRAGQRETPPVGRRGSPTNGLNYLGEH